VFTGRSSAGDAQGQPRGAAALHKPGDLVPVEAVGVDLGQRPGDAEPDEPVHPPVVHEQLFLVEGLVCRHDRFACPSLIITITLVIYHQL
jgi:hypothetical protein